MSTKFSINNIPEQVKQNMKQKNLLPPSSLLTLERLRLLELSHYSFDGKVQQGEMIVLDKVAESVILIFQELLKKQFPIYSICLMDKFDGDDELSMQANNSSCFNFRYIAGSDLLSMHAYGLAIDINPEQNPFLTDRVLPAAGEKFLNREQIRPGMVEPIIDIFHKHGFTVWGGNWMTPIDYHHFQIPRDQVNDLL